MLARYRLTESGCLNKTLLDNIPERYQTYHYKQMTHIKENKKRVVFDEFHHTGKSRIMRNQIINDMREGPK
jgi:intracellular multiplication protein IcmB